jgi:phosphatidate phosphatase PAH1
MGAEIERAFMRAEDVLSTPDKNISLKVKLEKLKFFPFFSDINKGLIDFFLGEQFLGSALTNANGEAHVNLEASALSMGTHVIKAKLNSKKFQANHALLIVTIIDEDTPIVVSDIDHTLADLEINLDLLKDPVSNVKELKNAKVTIDKFAKDYQVVYLTARDDIFNYFTKEWLVEKGFVPAPTFFRKRSKLPSDSGLYKEYLLMQMKLQFKNLLVGFGDKPHDVAAYRKVGMRAYYIGDQTEPTIHAESIRVVSWDQIWSHFNDQPLGTLATDPNL